MCNALQYDWSAAVIPLAKYEEIALIQSWYKFICFKSVHYKSDCSQPTQLANPLIKLCGNITGCPPHRYLLTHLYLLIHCLLTYLMHRFA